MFGNMESALTGNLLLDAMAQDLRERIRAAATFVNLPLRTPLSRPGEIPAAIYFLTGGLISVVVRMVDGGSAEVGMCGKEGIVGANALLGPMIENSECFMQVAGAGFCIPIERVRQFFDTLPEFRRIVLAYVQEQVVIGTQTVACNRLHGAESRLARWLLMVSDRIASDTLTLKQEFLAEMLGTQRSTVVLVAGQLQEAGAITYSRGIVRILDRPLLERHACECYAITRRALDSLWRYGPAQAAVFTQARSNGASPRAPLSTNVR